MVFEPCGEPPRTRVEHPTPRRAYLSGMLVDDLHAAHIGLVQDGGRDDLHHHLVAGEGKKLFVGGARTPRQQVDQRHRFRPRVAQEFVRLVFQKDVTPLSGGFLEAGVDAFPVDGGLHTFLSWTVSGKGAACAFGARAARQVAYPAIGTGAIL